MGLQYDENKEAYRKKVQTHFTSTLEGAIPADFKERKVNKLGVATAKLAKACDRYSSQIQLTTQEKTALVDDFENQLKAIKAVTSTRFVDVFDLLIMEFSDDPHFLKEVTMKEAHDHNKFYEIKIDDVCHLFGITYAPAYHLLKETGEILRNNLKFNFTDKKRKYGTSTFINGVSSATVQKGALIVHFTDEFLYLLSMGERRPVLVPALKYDAKQLKYMGQLRNRLESQFWLNHLNSGQYQRISLAHIAPLFYGANIKQRPRESFINPLKRHLSFLEDTGFFKFTFTGAKGAPLSADFRAYLDVNKDGGLIRESDAGEGVSTVPRIKVNELLNNVYISYTFLKRPNMKITKKTAQRRRRAKEAKSKQ